MDPEPNGLLPVGTRLVARVGVVENGVLHHPPGAVGIVTTSPVDATHAYRVRFPGGIEVALTRREFALLSRTKEESTSPLPDPLRERNLREHVIYRCIVGSRAYGLSTEASDTDRRGVYLPPASLHWSLAGVPEQLEDAERQECYWEMQKFLVLALKSNPNVLECLWTPLVEHADPLALELRDMRDAFSSRLVYQTYNGYALSQFRKIEADVRNHGEVGWKHAMHVIRLLLGGITMLRTGVLEVQVGEARERLLAIREARVPWADVNAWRKDLHREFDEAFAATRIPDRPDYARVEAFLIRARRSRVDVPAPEPAP
ncbi:MAG TPA: nucleotidyltransferase domain-containing protein [Planctomycetota bacterium]|nr:nucleotidyltransferase domain-containing protein [Planctomycetota bacterium]